MKVLFAPDWRAGNPYQQLLADALAGQGVEVVFAPAVHGLFRLTKAARAAAPFDLLHLHWPEAYFPILHDKRDLARRLLFPLDLRLAAGGRPLVWTAHNLYPHGRGHSGLDRMDTAAVVRRADGILAHSAGSVSAVVGEFGVDSAKCHVIPHGDLSVVQGQAPGLSPVQARRELGIGEAPLCLVFGAVDPYKGIEKILDAWADSGETRIRLAIVGAAKNAAYADALRARVAAMPNASSVILHLKRVDGAELARWLTAADCMLFNYHEILTSGSACLARSWGVPIALPARLGTVDLMEPCANVVRFDDTPEAMLAAVRRAVAAGPLPEAAAHYRAATAWEEIARQTAGVYRTFLKRAI